MENAYEIAVLVQCYLTGNASKEEVKRIEQWLAEDPRHQEMMREFQCNDWENTRLSEYEIFDKDQALERFLKSKKHFDHKRTIQRYSSIAALLLLSLGIAVYTMFSMQEETKVAKNVIPTEQKAIQPGSTKAMLVLGDGEVIMLSDSVKLELTKESIKVKMDKGRLNHQISGMDLPVVTPKPSLNTIIIPRGGEYELMLADGTHVWLNADSELSFPSEFIGKERVVHIKGEAYFEVAKDSLHPFLIHTENAVVQVLGTSFNVRAYPGDIEQTTLMEGRVAVYCSGKVNNLLPNEQWTFDREGGKVRKVDPNFALSWKNGDFAFEEQKLFVVFKELERWYDIHFQIGDQQLNDIRFTGIFPRYSDLNRVLEIIELATCMHCQLENQNIVVVNGQK